MNQVAGLALCLAVVTGGVGSAWAGRADRGSLAAARRAEVAVQRVLVDASAEVKGRLGTPRAALTPLGAAVRRLAQSAAIPSDILRRLFAHPGLRPSLSSFIRNADRLQHLPGAAKALDLLSRQADPDSVAALLFQLEALAGIQNSLSKLHVQPKQRIVTGQLRDGTRIVAVLEASERAAKRYASQESALILVSRTSPTQSTRDRLSGRGILVLTPRQLRQSLGPARSPTVRAFVGARKPAHRARRKRAGPRAPRSVQAR